MQADIDMQYGALLQPIIERTISKHMRSRDNRLAFLLARAAYESGMTKGLVLFVLKQAGVDQKRLKAMLDESSRKARTTLLKRTPQLETVLSEVAAWLEENDDAL
jgi:predicted HAD superfamily phosphohydrolase